MNGETTTPTILVVDDDPDIREIIVFALDSYGYPTVAVRDGATALGWLRANPGPALILLDLMMPELGGIAFLEAYRLNPVLSAIPVVVMSGDSNAGEVASRLGAHGCLKKPMDLDQLIATVERWARPPGTRAPADPSAPAGP